MSAFLRELRARNVDRAALAYAGAAWLLAQGGQLLAEAYSWPGWVIRALLAALMLGFPLVLLLAWFFELTPAGLVAGTADGSGSAIRLRTRRKLDIAIGVLVVAGLAALALTRDWRAGDSTETPRPAPAAATLAVLPFRPLVASTRDEALELGMTDTLIARLGSIADVAVTPLSTVRRYSAIDQDALAAGRELEVASVLDGSIQHAGDRLRVTVRLLDVAAGRQLWSAQFDEQHTDVLAVQDSIAARVISALALQLTDADRRRVARFRSRDPEAYHLYVMARGLWRTRSIENVDRAIDYLDKAVARDPDLALLHAGIADCNSIKAVFGAEPPRPLFARAHAAASRALALDPDLTDARVTLAHLRMHYELDWSGAEREYLEVIAIDPAKTEAHYRLGLLRGFSGRIDQGLAELTIARQLEPLWAPAAANTARLLHLAGRLPEAETEARRAIEMAPDFDYGWSVLGRVLASEGRYQEALDAFRRRDVPGPAGNADIARTLVLAGRLDEARGELARLMIEARRGYVPAYDIALVHAALGEREAALDWLDKAVDERSTLALVPADPLLEILADEPRYRALLVRLGVRDAK